MAHIFVKNSLSNLKAAKLDVNFPIYVTTDSEGDPIWVLETATTYPSASGTDIRPSYVNKATAFEDLDEAIAASVSEIARQIDWLPLVEDDHPPYVSESRPVGANVSIASNIYIDIQEDAPSAGIDLSDIKVILNNGEVDIDITNDCTTRGNPFFYNIHWRPPARLTKHYDDEE